MKWNLKGDIISWLFYVGKSGLVSWCSGTAICYPFTAGRRKAAYKIIAAFGGNPSPLNPLNLLNPLNPLALPLERQRCTANTFCTMRTGFVGEQSDLRIQ